jgi:putative sterol carrier protein
MTEIATAMAAAMTENLRADATIGGTIMIDMAADGQIFIDGRQPPPIISVGAQQPADCILRCSAATFEGLLDGSIDGTRAYMTGKLRITGRDELANAMDSLFR